MHYNQTKKLFENWNAQLKEVKVALGPEYQKFREDILSLYNKAFNPDDAKRITIKYSDKYSAAEKAAAEASTADKLGSYETYLEILALNLPTRQKYLKRKDPEQYKILMQDKSFKKNFKYLVKVYKDVKEHYVDFRARNRRRPRKASMNAFAALPFLAAMEKLQRDVIITSANFAFGFSIMLLKALDPRTWDAIDWFLFVIGFVFPYTWLAGLFRGAGSKIILSLLRNPAAQTLFRAAKKSPQITNAARKSALLLKKFREFKKSPVWNSLDMDDMLAWGKVIRFTASFYVAIEVWGWLDETLRKTLDMPREKAEELGISEEDLKKQINTIMQNPEYQKFQQLTQNRSKLENIIIVLEELPKAKTKEEAKQKIDEADRTTGELINLLLGETSSETD